MDPEYVEQLINEFAATRFDELSMGARILMSKHLQRRLAPEDIVQGVLLEIYSLLLAGMQIDATEPQKHLFRWSMRAIRNDIIDIGRNEAVRSKRMGRKVGNEILIDTLRGTKEKQMAISADWDVNHWMPYVPVRFHRLFKTWAEHILDGNPLPLKVLAILFQTTPSAIAQRLYEMRIAIREAFERDYREFDGGAT